MVKCDICGKECRPLGLSAHKRFAHSESGKAHLLKLHEERRGKIPWNKGLTSVDDERIRIASEKISKSLIGVSHPQTEETKKKISEKMKIVGGGYRKGSGIGKSGWYKSIWCDSSWELAFVLWCEINNKEVKRCSKTFQYEFDGKTRKYHPDFEVDGQIIEIKGRREMNDEILAKTKSCQNIKVLLEHEMKPILDEIVRRFGKNFIELYRG